MKVLIDKNEYKIVIHDTFIKKMFSLINKKEINNAYFLDKTNKTHTYFFKTNVDIIGLNEKNVVIFKYVNAPRNKLIEINNNKINTNLLILPKNSSIKVKINDILTFINEYEI